MNPGQQAQAGYMFRIAREQLVNKSEHVVLFAAREHWFNNYPNDPGRFVFLAQLQINHRDFQVAAII